MPNRTLTTNDRANSSRLKRIWLLKKEALQLNQTSAAKKLGYSGQGVVGQYLNAHIALGVEAVLRFADLLKVPPTDIDPSLEKIITSDVATVDRYEIAIEIVEKALLKGRHEATLKKKMKLYRMVYNLIKDDIDNVNVEAVLEIALIR